MTEEKVKKDDVFAITCNINGVRVRTDKLTKRQASIFATTAKHFLSYLKSEYGIK